MFRTFHLHVFLQCLVLLTLSLFITYFSKVQPTLLRYICVRYLLFTMPQGIRSAFVWKQLINWWLVKVHIVVWRSTLKIITLFSQFWLTSAFFKLFMKWKECSCYIGCLYALVVVCTTSFWGPNHFLYVYPL